MLQAIAVHLLESLFYLNFAFWKFYSCLFSQSKVSSNLGRYCRIIMSLMNREFKLKNLSFHFSMHKALELQNKVEKPFDSEELSTFEQWMEDTAERIDWTDLSRCRWSADFRPPRHKLKQIIKSSSLSYCFSLTIFRRFLVSPLERHIFFN